MLSEEKARRVMGKRVAQCRVNTGNKQKSWKADVVGSNLGVESDLICIQLVSTPASPVPRNRKLSVLPLDKLWESGVAVKIPQFVMPLGSSECLVKSSPE